MRSLLSLTLMVAALAVGCSETQYDHTEFSLASSPPLDASLTSNSLELTEGIAIKVWVAPFTLGQYEYGPEARVAVVAEDDSVVRVFPTRSNRGYVLAGQAPGQTCLGIEVDGFLEECVPLTVLAQ